MYFSEALIIFTSNLGVVSQDAHAGNKTQTITPDMDYNTIQDKLLSSIKDYFKYTIKRPELLNRMGDNFIVFDFIRKDAAEEILDLKLKAISENMNHEKGVTLEIGDCFKQYLQSLISENLSNGGRGISNMVETHVINPLAQLMIKENWHTGSTIIIEDRPISPSQLPQFRILN